MTREQMIELINKSEDAPDVPLEIDDKLEIFPHPHLPLVAVILRSDHEETYWCRKWSIHLANNAVGALYDMSVENGKFWPDAVTIEEDERGLFWCYPEDRSFPWRRTNLGYTTQFKKGDRAWPTCFVGNDRGGWIMVSDDSSIVEYWQASNFFGQES